MQLSKDDRELYFEKACIAHRNGDEKLSAVLLYRIRPFAATEQYHLLTVVTYNIWLKGRGTANEKQLAEDTIAAFSDYFRDVPTDEIPVFEYVKLSQLYITLGALQGALDVLKIASTKGHLTSTIIVLQSWTLVARISTSTEADTYINYLATAISLENRDNITDGDYVLNTCEFKLKYLYLFCCLRQIWGASKARTAVDKREYVKHFNALLTEAYVFFFKTFHTIELALAWFNSHELWWDVSEYLFTTPFILLAEDALWESFLRNSLLDYRSLKRILKCMNETNRKHASKVLMEKAYNINPWNLFVRAWLYNFDVQRWRRVFMTQDFLLAKVQGCVRGWSLRRNFEPIRQTCLARLKVFQDKMDNAAKKYGDIQSQRLLAVLRLWRSHAQDLKLLKYKSAQFIQKIVRQKSASREYELAIRRVFRANSTFITAVETLHNMKRITRIRRWYNAYLTRIRTRAADVVAAIITINGNSKKFLAALDILKQILCIRKGFCWRKFFGVWRTVYIEKIRRKARVSIRFQVRNIYRKREEIKQELEMQKTLAKMAKLKIQNEFTPNPLKVYKKFWDLWTSAFKEARSTRLIKMRVAKFIKNMRVLVARKRDKSAISKRRTMREIETAFGSKKHFIKFYGVFRHWLANAMILRIQRGVRVFIAKSRCHRRRHIHETILHRNMERIAYIYGRFLFRWKKFIFLQHREEIRSSLVLTRSFRMWSFKKRIKFNLLRKLSATRFSNILAFIMKRFLFRVVVWRINYIHMESRCGAMFSSVLRKNLHLGFKFIIKTAHHQKKREQQFHVLEKLLVFDKIAEKFWSDAFVSVRFTNALSLKAGHGLYSWEKVVTKCYVRQDNFDHLPLSKCFRTMIALYRLRTRFRRNSIRHFSQKIFDHTVVDGMTRRADARIVLSSVVRGFLSRLKTRNLISRSRTLDEVALVVSCKRSKRILHFLHSFCKHRYRALVKIQHWSRLIQAKIRVQRKRRSNYLLLKHEKEVHRKENLRIMKKYLMSILYAYIFSFHTLKSQKIVFSDEKLVSSIKKSVPRRHRRKGYPRDTHDCTGVRSCPNLHTSSINLSRYQQFQSVAFYNHLFRIKKSGIFTFDGSLNELSDNEIVYCAKECDAIFCPFASDAQLNILLSHFQGRKLMICGGSISSVGMQELIKFIATSSMEKDLSMSLGNVMIHTKDIHTFIGCVRYNHFPHLNELSVDFNSLGKIGVCSLFASLSQNTTLNRVIVDLADGSTILDILGPFLINLTENNTLNELHIQGLTLNSSCLQSIRHSCKYGLQSLTYLKFECDSDAVLEAEMLIDVCKNRSTIGRGISVTIDDTS